MIIYEDRPRAPPADERRGKSAKRAQSPLTVRSWPKALLDRHQQQMFTEPPAVVAVREYGHDATVSRVSAPFADLPWRPACGQASTCGKDEAVLGYRGKAIDPEPAC